MATEAVRLLSQESLMPLPFRVESGVLRWKWLWLGSNRGWALEMEGRKLENFLIKKFWVVYPIVQTQVVRRIWKMTRIILRSVVDRTQIQFGMIFEDHAINDGGFRSYFQDRSFISFRSNDSILCGSSWKEESEKDSYFDEKEEEVKDGLLCLFGDDKGFLWM